MNKIYKVIWNSQLKCWQAVSELAKNHSTSHSTVADKNTLTGSVKKVSAMALMRWALWGVALLPLSIYAAISNTELPTGANITQGSANIAQNGNTLNIHQNTQRLSTNWDTFNIGQNATVNFNQQNQSSIAINRVLDSNASQIMGRLNANGQVFLLNPNGVIFSKTAQVNVGGLVASTLSLNDNDIQNGKFTLTGNPKSTARVENHGSIQTLSGGTVALIAPNVKNTGRISSPNGTTHLTAASQVTLALQDGSLTQYQVDQGVFKGLVDNGGAIIADNGAVYLTAKAKDRLSKAVVNHSGIIEANRLSQNAKGEIILLGDMQNGETNVSGVLKAEGRNGQDGGFIETSAAKVKIENSTVVSTRSQGGKTGNWLIDPIDFNINAGNATQDSSGMGATTLANNLANNNVTVQSSTGGNQKGDINVNAEVKWDSANSLTLNAHNDININANITATHNKGKLNLIYGQDTANRDANYKLNKGAKINLRAGDNFSTKKGTEATVEYKVITALGKQDSTTGTDLQGINGNLNGNYVLGADIDAEETLGWNAGEGFNPIGDRNNRFNGKLDGLGHTVSKLYINRPGQEQNNIGLIGYARGAQIQNIGLLEVDIRGNNFVGALVGWNDGDSSIHSAYSTGSVLGNNLVGGLVGDNRGSIRNAYATGAVSGNDSVGGLVGWNLNNGSIRNAYATGAVSGKDRIGGLIGYHTDGTVENAYWNIETTGQKDSWNGGNGVDCNTNNYCGLTTVEMFQKNNMKGFDFKEVWGNANNQTTPYLLGLNDNQVFNKNDLPVGAITATNRPALYTAIQNIQQLQNMQSNLAGNYAVVNHIDATETKDWNDGRGFNPIGDENNSFKGKLDGLGHTVSKLSINRSTQDDIGLIGYAQRAQIRNIGLLDANIRGNNFVGALVGRSTNNSSIRNAYSTGVVSGSNNVGGLIGANQSIGSIRNAYSTSSVSGAKAVGGLVGSNDSRGDINNAYATGAVSGQTSVGGLVGENVNNGQINNAYATGAVSGQRYVGGLVGDNSGIIRNTYATGRVSGAVVGGLVGRNSTSIFFDMIKNSYWNTETTGQKNSWNGGNGVNCNTNNYCGLTSAQMKDGQSFAFIDADSYLGGKDTVWRIYQGDTAPLLRSFLTQLDLNTQDATTTYNGKNQSLADVTGLDPNKILAGKSGGYRNAGSHQDRYYSNQQGYDLIGVKNTASDAVLTINKATLNLNAVTDTRSYDGTNQSTGMVDISGLQTDDRVTAKQEFDSKNAGERTLNIAEVIINDGNNGGNYNIVTNTAKGVINKAKATVTANSLNTTYNGKEQTVSGFTASGLVNGETESVLTDVSAKATGKDAGNYANTAKGTDKNYELTFIDGALDIAKAKATVTANSLNTVYNGKDQTVSGFTASGLVNGETESVLSDVKASVSAKDAGQYANTTKGTDKNYELTFIDGALEIAKAKATVTANSLNTVYNGKYQTVSGFSASGLVNGETESVLTDVSAKATGKDAGNYVNKAEGIDKNYELIFVDGALDIDKAKINQVKGITANNRVYDGTTNASLNTDLAQFEGLLTGDELAVASATGKFNDKNVGVGKPVSIQDIRLTGADARNYQLVDNTAMTTADIYALTPLAYLQAKQFKPPRYLPETHNGFNTVDLEVQQGGVNIAGIPTLAGEH
ncbi:GLUG motif-containing protein [Acinetobacter guillouiae]|uniref:two-partner secretion domain-containing protein n=1 Tax=Acinetobacter guillouiae TaxID=106649 RepID=UPI001AE6C97E|nr:GLUG motif-containing protein [Acinetobacter guillouiae]MBP2542911.1 filamentous hemagglutinin family protein [Acinetobacter guillouiae]